MLQHPAIVEHDDHALPLEQICKFGSALTRVLNDAHTAQHLCKLDLQAQCRWGRSHCQPAHSIGEMFAKIRSSHQCASYHRLSQPPFAL